MKKKHIALIAAAALGLPVVCQGADYPWLNFKLSDGTELSVAADDLCLEYADGSLTLTSPTVSQRLEVSTLRSMQFAESPSAIEAVAAEEEGAVTLFGADGVRAGSFESVAAARAALPAGVYIVNGSGSSYKIAF